MCIIGWSGDMRMRYGINMRSSSQLLPVVEVKIVVVVVDDGDGNGEYEKWSCDEIKRERECVWERDNGKKIENIYRLSLYLQFSVMVT